MKAILKINLLKASQDDEITIVSEGSDENESIAELKKLVESDFETIHPSIEIQARHFLLVEARPVGRFSWRIPDETLIITDRQCLESFP